MMDELETPLISFKASALPTGKGANVKLDCGCLLQLRNHRLVGSHFCEAHGLIVMYSLGATGGNTVKERRLIVSIEFVEEE